MITPSFSPTVTERVLPKLALDFTTAVLDSRITFTRTGNTATVINSSGLVQDVNADTPRFDYILSSGNTCRGLLIEESRQNLCTQSEALNQAVWAKTGTCTIGGTTTAPDGNNTAYLVQNLSASSGIYYASLSIAAGTRFEPSFFILKGAATGTLSLTSANSPSYGNWSIDLSKVSSSWDRITRSHPAVAITTEFTGASGTYNGAYLRCPTGTVSVYVWGVQQEIGSFPTSYIPNRGAVQNTRNADVATMTGTNFSSWFNASEGGAVIQVLPRTISGTRPAVEFDDNTANETIVLRGVAADPQLYVVDGGAAQATLDAGTITANTSYRLAGAWKSSNFATAINGAASVSQLSGTYPTVTQARFGSDGTNYLNGWLQNFRYWPQRITNAETQAFSK